MDRIVEYLQKLLQEGKLNKYFYDQLNDRIHMFSSADQEEMIDQAIAMTEAGVSTEKHHRDFALVMMHVRHVAEDILGDEITTEQLADISQEVFKLKNDDNLNSIEDFYKLVNDVLINKNFSMKKISYPQAYVTTDIKPAYNLEKWSKTLNHIIYVRRVMGKDTKEIFNEATKDWSNQEKMDFTSWMKFYTSGDYLKYKTANQKFAQSYSPEYGDAADGPPGYFVPGEKKFDENDLRPYVPNLSPSNFDDSASRDQRDPVSKKYEKVQAEQQAKIQALNDARKKLNRRITSLLNIIISPEGKELLGDELPDLMSAIQNVQIRINVIKNARIMQDIIIKEANILYNNNKKLSSLQMLKLAQADPFAGPPMGGVDMGGMGPEQTAPTQEGNMPDGVDVFANRLAARGGPGTKKALKAKEKKSKPKPSAPSASIPPEMGMSDFSVDLDSLPEESPPSPSATAPSTADEAGSEAGSESIEPQAKPEKAETTESPKAEPKAAPRESARAPSKATKATKAPKASPPPERAEPAPAPKAPSKAPKEASILNPRDMLIVTSQEIAQTREPESIRKVRELDAEDAIEAALGQIGLEDVINRLEMISNIFRNREIFRQLAIVDLMMDKLGMSSYFPSLAEATRSALESNQYIQTRIDDILSKIQGAYSNTRSEEQIDLTQDRERVTTGPVAEVQQELGEQERLEEERKARRREREMQREEQREVAEQAAAQAQEELDAPVDVPEEVVPAARPAVPQRPARPQRPETI